MKTADTELGWAAGKAIGHGGQTEQGETERDAFLAPETVRQGAENQRTEHHAEQRIAAQGASLHGVSPHSRMIDGRTTP